jgi:hypothetical protein
VFWKQGVVSRIPEKRVSVRVKINPEPVPEVNDRPVRWQTEFQGQSNQVNFSEHTERLRVWLR